MAQISGNVNHSQALKQAEDYNNMGRKDQSFQFLYEYIMSAKKRGQWSGVFEKIMNLFIDLAIQQDKYSTIKDALLQYRYMSQQSNSESLQKVMEHFRDQIEQIFNNFIEKINPKLIENVDVDNDEDLIIYCMDQQQIQIEIELKNQIRQLIETYKIILENVRLNNKLEPIFVSTVEKWVQFCIKYKRKSEIKKLIDFQRTHLNKLIRGKQGQNDAAQKQKLNQEIQNQKNITNMINNKDYQQQQVQQQTQHKAQMTIDISQPNYNNIYQNVFMIQLDCLTQMGLWQEAFKTIEDIQNIRKKRKEYQKVEKNDRLKLEMIQQLKQQQSQLNFQYNKNLSLIFQKSNIKHLQAFSFYQYFEGIESEQIEKNEIEHLVLSVITINKSNEKQLANDLVSKLHNHINNGQINSKEEMVQLIRTNNILDQCSQPVKQLFYLLEDDFTLQKYKKQIQSILNQFNNIPQYSQYIESIQQVIMVKVIQSLSKVYRIIKLDKLQALIFFYDINQLQKNILAMNHKQIVQTKIDHVQNTIKFWEKENSRNSLINFIDKIVQVSQDINSININIQQSKHQKLLYNECQKYIDDITNYNRIRENQVLYTKNPQTFQDLQKDQLEEERKYLLQFEQKKREEELKRNKEEENIRLNQELKEVLLKNKQRAIDEIIQLKKKQVAKINNIQIEKLTEEDLEDIDLDTIQELKEKVRIIMKENVDNKNIKAFKKSDYLIRKRREEEFKIIKQQMDKQQIDVESIKKTIQDEHTKNIQLKQHFDLCNKFKQDFFGNLLIQKQMAYDEQIKIFKEMVTQKFKQRIIDDAMNNREKDIQDAQIRMENLKIEQEKNDQQRQINTKTINRAIIQRNEKQISEQTDQKPLNNNNTFGPITRNQTMISEQNKEQASGPKLFINRKQEDKNQYNLNDGTQKDSTLKIQRSTNDKKQEDNVQSNEGQKQRMFFKNDKLQQDKKKAEGQEKDASSDRFTKF